MGRKGVSYEQVVEIAEALLAEGVPLDAVVTTNVRARLQTGSNTTVGDHLATWRQKHADGTAPVVKLALPPQLAQPIAAFIKAQADAAKVPVEQLLAGERAARSAAEAECQRLLDEVDAARERIAQLEVTMAESSGRLKQAQEAHLVLDERLSAAQRQRADAEKSAAVAEARGEAAERRAEQAEKREAEVRDELKALRQRSGK